MDKYLLQILILSTIIFQTTAFSDKRICFFSIRIHVYIVNQFPANSPPLQLHCASGNNDLGHHLLLPGQEYTFNFCINFKTLFFCHFWWNEKDLAFEVFNNVGEHNRRCIAHGICYWELRSDGIYFSNDKPPNKLTKLYNW
ncbi:hypothetical protein PHJA_001414500 [Phtheirospermum japonicum]|uniref:S-protein homolog n=1 Tax=Phtheirospermum japonicum TaxID=374723 RepID=A0A830C9L8_9LAMI|nr:hypothetical protein PHJA_001414500 [Phtheirospermum japonicum]